MVYLSTPEEFLSESRLLLSARPLTARVTTTYTLPRSKPSKSTSTAPSAKITKESSGPEPATLVLKTFDPVSGTCLKYKTRKATELGRLLGALRTSAGVLAGVALDEPGISAPQTTGQGHAAGATEEKRDGEVRDAGSSTAQGSAAQGQGQSTATATGQGQEKAKKKKKGKK